MKYNKEIKKRIRKQFYVLLLVAAMLANICPETIINASVFSESISYEGYDVEYDIIEKWDNGATVKIVITNTGTEPIINWAFVFDAGGKINNMWNAQIVKSTENEYLIKNCGWNYVIEPEQSVDFGYTFEGDNYNQLKNFELCSKKIEEKDSYSIKMNIVNSWENKMQGELEICNISENPIEAWELSFDTNFTIDNIWDAKIIKSNGNNYTIACENWNYIIEAGKSVTIGFIGLNVANNCVSNSSLSSIVLEDNREKDSTNQSEENQQSGDEYEISLYSDADDILTENCIKTLHFYVSTENPVEKLSLVNIEADEVIAQMVDDGDYYCSGDDMKGDGIYSCKIDLDISKEKKYWFKAECEINELRIYSNEWEIFVYSEYTDDEIEEMKEVRNAVQNLFEKNGFKDKTIEEKKNEMYELLIRLARVGTEKYPYPLIKESSILFIPESSAFSVDYMCGGGYDIILEETEENCDGLGFNNGNYSLEKMALSELPFEYVDDGDRNFGDAIIMYAFDKAEFSLKRYPFYLCKAELWKENGLDTTIDKEVSIIDLKTKLVDQAVIILSMHGMIGKSGSSKVPVLCTKEKITDYNLKNYSCYLKDERIRKYRDKEDDKDYYYVCPKFFSSAYRCNELDNSTVFLNSCSGFGKDGVGISDYAFSVAFQSAGAEMVMGYHNSVYSRYGRNFIFEMVFQLLNGKTTGEAFDISKDRWGENEDAWCEEVGVKKHEVAAYPVMDGNENFKLIKDSIKNGGFEYGNAVFKSPLSQIKGWKKSGDVRIVSRLGEQLPIEENNMAMIGTGIGSAENTFLNNAKGSTLFQSIYIPEGAKKISFWYNMISEEPMEYVGSIYDDEFSVRLYDDGMKLLENVETKTINTSLWHRITGVDFPDGDDTVYQTTWKKVEIDVSSYTDDTIVLWFGVNDVGDSSYDTAVLIDHVSMR